MVSAMSAEQVEEQITRADKALREGQDVPKDQLSINLTSLYRRYSWSRGGPAPLPNDALKKLKLSDMTGDARWMAHFSSSAKQLGVYRTLVGYYWILRYDRCSTSTTSITRARPRTSKPSTAGLNDMAKSKSKRIKKQRKPSAKKKSSGGGGGGGGGGYGVSKRSSGGGVMQSLRSGFKRAAGVGGDEDRGEEKSSTLSNVLWTLLLLGAVAALLYKWYGPNS